MKKRVVSLLLCLIMALSLIPTVAFAAEASSQDDGISLTSIRPDDQKKYYTYKFYHGEDLISTQIVKEGDTLYQPATPTTEEGKVFTGWYDKAGNPFTDFGEIDEIKSNEIINLYARIEDGYYVFFMNGDTVIATKTGQTNDKVTFADVSFPVNADQAITGWYTDKELNTLASDPVTIETSNISLYAKVENGHWITFDSDGGSYVEPKFFATSADTEAPAAPTKPGYAFAGWYNGDTQYTFGNKLNKNIELKAHWTAQDGVEYTVIHWQENANDDGYSLKDTETMTGKVGAQTNAAAKDTKRVKDYNGFTAQTIVQKPIAGDDSTIVNVYYKRNEYVINFYSSNNPSYSCGKKEHEHRWTCYNLLTGELKCGKEEHRHTNDCLKPTHQITAKYGAYIRDQWPGGGWYVSPNSSTAQTSIDVMPLGGTNFYGEQDGYYTQTAEYYTEVLPGNEASGIYNRNDGRYYKLKYTDTTKSNVRLTVTNEDRYPITGFTCNERLSTQNDQYYNGAEFYYTRNSRDIVFISGGQTVKTVSMKYEQPINGADNFALNPPRGKEGYTLAGWYDNELCEGEKYDFTGKTMPDQNITLYAKWVAPVHIVTLYKTDKTTVYYKFENVSHNNTIDVTKIPTYEVSEGYKFLGWVKEDGTPFNFNTEITRNYNLYAKIGSMATYTVTYKANNGSDDTVVDPLKYAMGAYASVKANSFNAPSGQVFLGWSTTASGSVAYYANSKLEITGNMELYAIWGDKDSTVTLTYNANYEGADPAMSEVPSLKNNALVELAAATLFTRTGYEFTGWNTKADGSGTSFAAGSNARVDKLGENVLYAQWKRQTGTLTISKELVGLNATDFDKPFSFTVWKGTTEIETFDLWTGHSHSLQLAPGKYTIVENNANVDGYKLTTSFAPDYNVEVKAGANTAVVATNTYEKITGTVTIDKVLKGLNATDFEDGFAFDIKDASGKVVATVEKVFPGMAQPATVTLVPGTYTIVEKNADKDGYDLTTEYDKETFTVEAGKNVIVTVTNTYEKITGTVTIDKVLKGLNATDFEDGFAFDIKDASGKVVATVEKVFPGMAQPATVTLVPGTYTIVEKNADKDGYDLTTEYDKETFTVEAGKNVIVTVTNTYEKITGTVTIDKVLKGLNATDFEDGFAFDIKDASGKVVATVEKVFPGMAQPATVTLVPGTYTIVEKNADKDGYDLTTEYDKETFTVEAGKNVIVTVTNTYTKKVTPPPAEYTLSVDIQKNIELKRSSSRKPGKASFTFEAYLVDEKGNETILDTVTIDTKGTKSADGTLTFTLTDNDLSVTGHGTVYVREVKGSTRGWTYDDTVYALGVELTTDGKLNIISVDTKRIDKPATLEFTNVYYKRSTTTGGGDKPIQSVKTGDMGIAMYAMTSLLSLGGAALVIKKRKEEK